MIMHCPRCGAENPEGSRYCNLCLADFGFSDQEYTSSEKSNEGFMTEYPSIFKQPQDPIDPSSEGGAAPVDIGEYGARSEERPPDVYEDVQTKPVDIGQYGARSGANPERNNYTSHAAPGDVSAQKERKKRRRLFKRSR